MYSSRCVTLFLPGCDFPIKNLSKERNVNDDSHGLRSGAHHLFRYEKKKRGVISGDRVVKEQEDQETQPSPL